MKRRDFVWGTGALLGVLMTGGSAQAYGAEHPAGEPQAVRLLGQGRATRIERLVVSDGQQALALDWRGGAPLYYEDRVNLSGLGGGLGALFRTPFRVRWQRARPVGTVEIVPQARMLMARIDAAALRAGGGATLAAGAYSWDLPGRLMPSAAPGAFSGAGDAAGAVRAEADGRLLVLLPHREAQV